MRSETKEHGTSWNRIVPALLAVLLVFVPAAAGDPPQDTDKKQDKTENAEAADKPASDDPPPVYTTEDLEQRYGTPKAKPGNADTSTPAEEPAEQDDQALASVQDQVARERTRKQQLAKAQDKVDELEQQVRRLEDRILRIKNPLLKPPQADMSPDEIAEWEGMTNPERLEQTQRQLDEARSQLAEAQAEVQRLGKPS